MAFPKVGLRAVIEGLARFNRDAQLINKRLREVTGNVKKTEKASRNLGKTIEAWDGPLRKAQFALFGMAAAGGAFLVKATLLAARVETLGVVTETLGKNVGKTKDEIRALEQAVVDQGITLRGARTAIALMIQSNVDLSNAVNLAAEAQNAAVIAGVDSTEAFRRLVFVITSGNVRMARTLGLQVSFQEAYEKTAESLDKTTLELTQQEKVTARTSEVLKAGTRIVGAYDAAMETVGKKIFSLNRHLEEATRIMGEGYIPFLEEAVDALTAFLKGIEDATVAQQRGQSAMLGTVTALSAMGGASIFLIRKLPALITLLRELGLAGIATGGAVLALIAIFVQFTVSLARAEAEAKSLRGTFKDLAREVARELESFREYERRAFEAAEGTIAFSNAQRLAERTGMSLNEALRVILREQGLFTEAMFEGEEALAASAVAAESADKKFFAMAASMGTAKTDAELLAEAQDEAAAATERLAKQQEILKGKLDEVQLRIDTDVVPQFTDFKDEINELNQEISDLELEKIEAIAEIEARGAQDLEDLGEEIARLNERRADEQERLRGLARDLEIAKIRLGEMNEETSEASRLAAENRIEDIKTSVNNTRESISELTEEMATLSGGTDEMVTAQGQALSDLEREYLDKMRGRVADIDEVTAAWQRQTKEIVFNLATQRLGIDGFTREEIAALTTLAGPEGLGLIDEAAVALLEKIDESNAAMESAGDQSKLFAEDMASLAEIMSDPTKSVGEMAAAIRDLESAAVSLSADPTIAALLGRGLEPSGNFPGGFIRRHHGGGVQRGKPYLVGGPGNEEVFIPNQSGVVLPNSLTSAMTSFLTAATSAIPIAGGGASAGAAGGGGTTQNFKMTVNTRAPAEQIQADFALLALRGQRRG